MAKRYRPVQRDQVFLLPPSMREWLAESHPVWLVIAAVEVMDTSAFHAGRKTGGAGTAGYDPDMLVTVLAWAYAHGVTSSRRIEQLCGTDVAFRVICGGNLPDHTTIARFREEFPGAVAAFFAEVLRLCAQLGMGRLGVVALDGTKIAASASKSANRTEDTLATMAADAVAAHRGTDAAEDQMFGPGARGDEVPPDAWSPRSRDQRIAAALASLHAEREAGEAQRQAARQQRDQQAAEYPGKDAAGARPAGRAPAGAEVELARRGLERARTARTAQLAELEQRYAAGQPRRGRAAGIDDYCRVAEAAAALEAAIARQQARAAAGNAGAGRPRTRNLTDPDSRLMPVRGGGFVQGYNAQLVTSEDGLIIATTLTQDTGDVTWLVPMMAAAEDAAALITAARPAGAGSDDSSSDGEGGDGAWRAAGYRPPAQDGQPGYTGPIGLFLADAGYCSEDNIAAPGPPRLIATGKRRDLERQARDGDGDGPARAGPHTDAMAALLQTGDGITAYRHRGHIAETPNGDIKENKGFRQLSVRGLAKASAEWQFTTATVNLVNGISNGRITHAGLSQIAALPGYGTGLLTA